MARSALDGARPLRLRREHPFETCQHRPLAARVPKGRAPFLEQPIVCMGTVPLLALSRRCQPPACARIDSAGRPSARQAWPHWTRRAATVRCAGIALSITGTRYGAGRSPQRWLGQRRAMQPAMHLWEERIGWPPGCAASVAASVRTRCDRQSGGEQKPKARGFPPKGAAGRSFCTTRGGSGRSGQQSKDHRTGSEGNGARLDGWAGENSPA